MFGKLGGFGGSPLGGALKAVTGVVNKVQGGVAHAGPGADTLNKVMGDLHVPDLGKVLPTGANSPGLFNGATTEQVLNAEPAHVEFGTGRLGVAILSGPDAHNDDSTISLDLLSFGNNADHGAPPLSLGFGPEDATNLDIEILSGSYDTSGTGAIQIGPDIWGGGSPLSAHLLHDFNDVSSNDTHVGENLGGPVTDGTLLAALAATISYDSLFAA